MKTTSPFPIYDRMVTSGQAKPNPSLKFIDARQPLNLISEESKDRPFDADTFGPVVPPYPSIWLETDNASLIAEEDDPGITGLGIQIEMGTDSWDTRSGRNFVTNRIAMWIAIDGTVVRNPVCVGFTTDLAGHLDNLSTGVIEGDEQVVDAYYGTPKWEALAQQIRNVSIGALFSISLMHCRNVRQTPATYQPQPRRKTSRKRPAIDYHIIQLPAPKGSGRSNPGNPGEHGSTRLHTARGHFKTYTAEKPLLGRHVGTYYWGWQVRGNPENGEIVSSYKVGANA
jgi:hypothetical protein